MAGQKRTRGKCTYCQREMTRAGMGKHMADCPVRTHAIAEANNGDGKLQPLYHLQVQDAWGGDFWLHLEMNGEATLKQLDRYLRAIWLECCGHLSEFYLEREYGTKAAMTRKIEQALSPGSVVSHLRFRHVFKNHCQNAWGSARQAADAPPDCADGPQQPAGVYVHDVRKPATYICLQCLNEDEATGELCDVHVKKHPHHDYGDPLPLVNSPRSGMCGYEGPAEPPY